MIRKTKCCVEKYYYSSPLDINKGLKKGGNAWKHISENLNQIRSEQFKVDQRAVRERFGVLKAHTEAKNREELIASGIAPECTPVEQAVEDILEQMKECEKHFEEEENTKNGKSENEKRAAEEMRLKAMETYAESKKRKGSEENEEKDIKLKKSRSSGSDTLVYLKEKAESEKEFKLQELEIKKKKYELQEAQHQIMQEQQQQMFSVLKEQAQLQQQQSQQMFTLMSGVLKNLPK